MVHENFYFTLNELKSYLKFNILQSLSKKHHLIIMAFYFDDDILKNKNLKYIIKKINVIKILALKINLNKIYDEA